MAASTPVVIAGCTAPISIGWNGTLANVLTAAPIKTDERVTKATGVCRGEPSLAEQTGLVVSL
ncbi:hypothetical protein [Azospira restricta]|uniref:hypothetical protein n=1 Tax=Azospira restricta TaxID=404405 RepID=UPI001EF15FBC|nr:hypothetical protein [Azospira restricta]